MANTAEQIMNQLLQQAIGLGAANVAMQAVNNPEQGKSVSDANQEAARERPTGGKLTLSHLQDMLRGTTDDYLHPDGRQVINIPSAGGQAGNVSGLNLNALFGMDSGHANIGRDLMGLFGPGSGYKFDQNDFLSNDPNVPFGLGGPFQSSGFQFNEAAMPAHIASILGLDQTAGNLAAGAAFAAGKPSFVTDTFNTGGKKKKKQKKEGGD